MALIELLQAKTRCLKKFLQVTQEGAQELASSGEDRLSEVERRRDAVLKAIQHYDSEIEKSVQLITAEQKTESVLAVVRTEYEAQQQLVAEILRADEELFRFISNQANRMRSEIESLSQVRKNLSKHERFKSQWVASSGEGLDTKL